MSDAGIDIDVDLGIERALDAIDELRDAVDGLGRRMRDDLDVEPRIDATDAERELRDFGDTADREAADAADAFGEVDDAIEETGRRTEGLGTTMVTTWGEIFGAIEQVLGALGDVQRHLDEVDQRSLGTASVSAQLGLSNAEGAAVQDLLRVIDRDVTDVFGLFSSVQEQVADPTDQSRADFAALGFDPALYGAAGPLARLDYLSGIAGGVGNDAGQRAALGRLFGESDAGFALELAGLTDRTGVGAAALARTYRAVGFGQTEEQLADAAADQLQASIGERLALLRDSGHYGFAAQAAGFAAQAPFVGDFIGDIAGFIDRSDAGPVIDIARRAQADISEANATALAGWRAQADTAAAIRAEAESTAAELAAAAESVERILAARVRLARGRTAASLRAAGASELAPTERGTIAGETDTSWADTVL